MTTEFPVRLLVVWLVWIVVLGGLAWRLFLFPRYTYQSLQETPGDFELPPRKWWYGRTDPFLWTAILVAGTTIAGIIHLRNHPTTSAYFFRWFAGVVVWLRDGDLTQFFVAPWASFWMLLTVIAAFSLVRASGNVLVSELLLALDPGYFVHRWRYSLGRWRRPFDKEWQHTHGKDRTSLVRTCLIGLIVGAVLLGIVADDEYSLYILVGSAFVASCVLIACGHAQRTKQKQEIQEEIGRRFHPLKLLSENRRILWRHAFRAWALLPAFSLLAATAMPFYTFDSDGMRTHLWGQESVIPWEAVLALRLQIHPPRTPEHSSKKDPEPPPELEVTVHSTHGDIELNKGGMIGLDPLLIDDLFAEFRQRNVPVTCARSDDDLRFLEEFLSTRKAKINSLYSQKLELIAKLCARE